MTLHSETFAGFWRRVGATLIDILLLVLVTFPILIAIYGMAYFEFDKSGFIAGPADFLISYAFPAVATIWFWIRYRGTPGKLVLRALVVDAETGNSITLRQSLIRYIGYFICLIPLGLGLLWVAFDARKQGWHDKLAGTVVVIRRSPSAA